MELHYVSEQTAKTSFNYEELVQIGLSTLMFNSVGKIL